MVDSPSLTSLSTVILKDARVTPNVEFLVDDAEDEWIGTPYDFIHIRMLSGAIKDWPGLFTKAFNHLNPGGWLEVTEFEVIAHSYNNTMEQAPDIKIWQEGLQDAASKIGRRMDVAIHLEEWVRDSGFTDVVQHKITVPNSPWPKDKEMKMLGSFQLLNMLDATSAYGQAHFTRVLGWSASEYEVLSANARTQLKNPKLQLYSDMYVLVPVLELLGKRGVKGRLVLTFAQISYTVYGRKPSTAP